MVNLVKIPIHLLNGTLATHCPSDFEKILVGPGANDDLLKICPICPSNLTEASCPVNDVSGLMIAKILYSGGLLVNLILLMQKFFEDCLVAKLIKVHCKNQSSIICFTFMLGKLIFFFTAKFYITVLLSSVICNNYYAVCNSSYGLVVSIMHSIKFFALIYES